MTSFTVIVPARLAATRLPSKPLADIGGVAMIIRTLQQAAAAGSAPPVAAIASEDEELIAAVEQGGFTAVRTGAHSSGSSRVAEAAAIIGLNEDSIIVNLQADEPFIEPPLLAAVAGRVAAAGGGKNASGGSGEAADATAATTAAGKENGDAAGGGKNASGGSGEAADATAATNAAGNIAAATLCRPLADSEEYRNPNVVKTAPDAHGNALYFSRAAEDAPPDAARAHIGVYAYRLKHLRHFLAQPPAPPEITERLEQLRILWHGGKIALVECESASFGIDTEADLARARDRAAATDALPPYPA